LLLVVFMPLLDLVLHQASFIHSTAAQSRATPTIALYGGGFGTAKHGIISQGFTGSSGLL
jgi:hypothetical protein